LELPTQLELDPAWLAIRAELRRAVGQSTYEIWLAPLEVRSWDGAVLMLAAPAATQAWTARRYSRIIERCARDVVGSSVTVSFAEAVAGELGRKSAHSSSLAAETKRDQPINPRLNFNQFIIGDGNRLAHAAALSVAEIPGQAYNPLFLYAPPGLGKTHLLHAIANYVLAYGGGTTVRYTTVEAFTNHFISALNSRQLDHFKHLYRDADVLLVDDVQFLASKAKTEEEFFHTFNALYETGRQLVLTCDRLPRQLPRVEERLRERFESGLVAELGAPDFVTRIAILRKRVALDQIALGDPSVIELIAERVTDNIRALEGALIRVVAHHSLRGQPINLELATAVLDEIHPLETPAGISVARIQQVVAAYFEITAEQLVSPNRSARIAWARQVAIHLARELTATSLQQLGNAFGGRNHATVLYACKKVDERLENDPEAVNNLKQLHALLVHDGADLGS
jgi:chromosomal replication initiator protein